MLTDERGLLTVSFEGPVPPAETRITSSSLKSYNAAGRGADDHH
jgi:hypothetical protein